MHARCSSQSTTFGRRCKFPIAITSAWDGKGYPRGLKGEEIPLAARIFTTVDVWDALVSDRPYRVRWENERVRTYLKENSGIYFDPAVVATFLAILGGEDPMASDPPIAAQDLMAGSGMNYDLPLPIQGECGPSLADLSAAS